MRVLILCADIGEGHLSAARALERQLRGEPGVQAVGLHTDLSVLGPRLGGFLTRGFRVHLDRVGWSYDLAYRVFFCLDGPRRASQLALAALGSRGLHRTIAAFRPHVVVTEYPVLSAALGQLRALGRLSVPVCSSVSDPAGLYYWAHPGVDLHLVSWPEARAEVERIAGPGRAVVVRPAVGRRFAPLPPPTEARAALQLPGAAPVILVSGGGWGMGDLAGAAATALATVPDAVVICLAGRSEQTRRRLLAAYGSNPRVRVLGFSDRMPELLSAADVLIHTTGGTTALEARIVGCRLLNYGTGPAHVRAHARAMADRGLATWAPDQAALGPALAATLARQPPPRLDQAALPDPAPLILGLARHGRRPDAGLSAGPPPAPAVAGPA